MKNDIFPDWLPPALVKDLRQMLRSPLYVLGVLALVGAGIAGYVPRGCGCSR